MAAALAACQPTSNGPVDPASKPAVGSARALTLFDAICGGSYPSFDDAVARMAANGISTFGDSGIIYSNSENLSFKLVPDNRGNKSCSIVFATRESNESVINTLASRGALNVTDDNTITVRLPSGGTAILGGRPVTLDGLTYHNIRLISER